MSRQLAELYAFCFAMLKSLPTANYNGTVADNQLSSTDDSLSKNISVGRLDPGQ